MFDTMTLTKIIGGICGTFLIFLLGKWGVDVLYHPGGGHGDEAHTAAYVIETDDEDQGDAMVEAGLSFADLYAVADPGAGKRLWGKCRACHKIKDGANGVGPHLYGIVGRNAAAVDGFNYSGALADLGRAWTPEELDTWLENPRAYAPGNKMSYAGMRKTKDRANLIAYLATIGDQ